MVRRLQTRYVILDWTKVRIIHLQVLIGSAILFFIYIVILLLIRHAFDGILLGLIIISLQVPFGLVSTRYFQGYGRQAKEQLRFLDIKRLEQTWTQSSEKSHIGEITSLLDDISTGLHKYKPSFDDLLDIVWFGVLVWAVLSTAIIMLFNPPSQFYTSPALVQAGLCGTIYYNGYMSSESISFEDEIEHLKHTVLSRISTLHSVSGKRYFQPEVILLSKGKKRALADIVIDFSDSVGEDQNGIFNYTLALPTSMYERLTIDVSDKLKQSILQTLEGLPIVQDNEWKPFVKAIPNGYRIQLCNMKDSINLGSDSSMFMSPSRVEEVSHKLGRALAAIYEIIES
ncbi:MAG: hypothetical protein ACFFD6_10190 [Candidatus Thorarchaeota archaeon]